MNYTAFEGLMDVCVIPESERVELRNGVRLLDQLGWPENFIDLGMCKRAANGMRIPTYEGMHSFAEYKRMLQEDQREPDLRHVRA
jgi:hypothetical protein